MMDKMNKANAKGKAGMARKPSNPASTGMAKRNSAAAGRGYAKGGLVFKTGKLDTGIPSCGHKKG